MTERAGAHAGAAGDGMLHPVPLVALLVLVVNDHVLKHAWPGVVTGKLSDFAGLVFFPLLLVALSEVALRIARKFNGPSRRALIGAVVITGLVFALTKTTDAGADFYRASIAALQWPFYAARALINARDLPGLGSVRHVADPTDLVALPSLALAYFVGRSRT